MKTVLIDDEENNLLNLQGLLTRLCPEVEVVATARSADAGRQVILQHKPELLFLDIQMPEKSGFDLLQSLPGYDFDVIIVTAYDQFGIQAVKFSAIDYLLKPVDSTELREAVNKVIAKRKTQASRQQIENLLHFLREEKNDHRIALNTQKETRFVPVNQIVRCESNNNYTSVFLLSKEKIVVSRPIFEFEEMLSSYAFIRCHQSHLVNKRYVKSWMKDDGSYLLMEDGSQVPVSRNKKEYLMQVLKAK